jgi:hypothetical protein
MKTHPILLGLTLGLAVRIVARGAPAPTAEPPDPIIAAIQAASQPASNPPPAVAAVREQAVAQTEAAAQNQPAPKVVPMTVPDLVVPKVQGGTNQVFVPEKHAETPANVVSRMSSRLPSDEDLDTLTKERARIRLLGDYEAEFRGAALNEVVRALAERAQMRYIAPAGDALTTSVSIAGTYNVLDLLDLIQEHYSVAMTFERGTWRFEQAPHDALVVKTYALHNNNRATVEITSPTINTIGGGSGSNGGSSTGTGASGSNSGGGAGGGAGGDGGGGSFKIDYKDLTKDIEDLLSIPIPSGDGDKAKEAGGGAGSGSKVKFLAETNEVMVIASRYHQRLVQEYLEHVDKPLDQIEFSAYFVESAKDPTTNIGVNWSSVTASSEVSGTQTASKYHFALPKAGILNAYDFAAAINATATDSLSCVVQNPTVVGLPNRKTVFDATRQIPVAQSSFNAGGSVNPSTSTSLQYMDVGTIVNIYPEVRRLEDGSKMIRMHTSLVVSSYLGDKTVSGNPAPLTSRRRFEFSADVPEGHTLVVGGLVSNSSNETITKLPYISSLPLIGHLFKDNSEAISRSNLVVYITPRILHGDLTALGPELPRVFPEDPMFNRPVFDAANGSLADVRRSLMGFDREVAATTAYIDQHRDPKVIDARLVALRKELIGMEACLDGLRKQHIVVDPRLMKQVSDLESQISSLRRSLLFAS